jgi:transposase
LKDVFEFYFWYAVYISPATKMGRRGNELGQESKNIIINLSNTGHSSYKISEITGLNRRTVSNFLKRFHERGNTENSPRSGRQRKLDERAKRRLVRMVHNNRRQTLEDLTSKFNNSAVIKVSLRTVRRRLFDNKYKQHVVSKTITIRKVNRSRRTSFCRQKLHWNVHNNRRKVIFSDETKIVIGQDKKIYV